MLVEIFCDKFKTGGKDGQVRPAISFHEGLNAVIGDDNRSNSIGKSTLLMIIDFVFGGNDYINKCAAVHNNVGDHTIFFTLAFDGVEYSFGRNTTKNQEVFTCDRTYKRKEESPIKLADYMAFLADKYKVNIENATWRGVVSKFIRVHNRDTMDVARPLQASKDEKIADSIKGYLKQFERYSVVEGQVNQAKVAEEEKEAFRKSVAFNHIKMVKTETEYNENAKLAETLEKQEQELSENSDKGLLNLDEIQLRQLSELNDLLLSYTRQRARVNSQLNSLRREMTEGKKSFKKSYADLERFFPGVEFKTISEIENFHQSLSKVLTNEFKDTEKDLVATNAMLSNEIKTIEKRIAEIKNVPNVSQAVLREYAKITTELNNLRAANENFKTFNELKATAKEYADARDAVIAIQLSAINTQINKEMSIITMRIVDDAKIIPPVIRLEKMNAYYFDTNGDDGSGTANRGLITFDLANMYSSCIPFIVHDADLMDPIEKHTLTKIIKEYDSVKTDHKQTFVSFRSYEFYEEEAKPFLDEAKVLQLAANGNELFGWAWNKEQDNK